MLLLSYIDTTRAYYILIWGTLLLLNLKNNQSRQYPAACCSQKNGVGGSPLQTDAANDYAIHMQEEGPYVTL